MSPQAPRVDPPRALRVALYARCSGQKQAEKDLSIPAQLDAGRAEAQRQGWQVVSEYIDAAKSGRYDDRAQFQEMVRDARKKPRPFDIVLVWKLSRFARSREHSVIYKRQLAKAGVRCISLCEPVDDTPSGRLLVGIIESLDQFYSENLAEDTSRGMRKNASLGYRNGGPPPVGYRKKRSSDGPSPKIVLEPDPVYGPVVQRIFRMSLGGEGATTIAHMLNEEGILRPNGHPWTVQNVLYILRNEVYLGINIFGRSSERVQHGEPVEPVRVENAHEALVSATDFQAVQQVIARRSMPQTHPRRLGFSYLLSGLIFCAKCGSPLIGHPAKSGTVHYYRCQKRLKVGPKACDGRLLNRDAAEGAVADRIRDVVLTPEHLRTLIDLVNEEIRVRTKESGGQREALEAQLRDARKRLDNLYDALETGRLTIADVADRIKHWKEQVTLVEGQIAELDQKTGGQELRLDDDAIRAYVENLRDLLAHGSLDARRAFLQAWIKRIEVRDYTLVIEYTFPFWSGGGGGSEASAEDAPGMEDDTVIVPSKGRRQKALGVGGGVLAMLWYGTPYLTLIELGAWMRGDECSAKDPIGPRPYCDAQATARKKNRHSPTTATVPCQLVGTPFSHLRRPSHVV